MAVRPYTSYLLFFLQMTLSVAALVAVNLIPLVGVFFFEWDIGPILLLYWSENLVVGGYNMLKILVRPAEHPMVYLGRLFPIAFFCFHYGAFCGVHGFFLLAFLESNGVDNILSGSDWPFFLVFVQILVETIYAVWSLHRDVLTWPLVALVISHGVSFTQNFWGKREFENATTEQLMQQPYKRIVLLHVAIIAGGFAVMLLGSPLPLLVLIVIGKIALDIHLHRREHRPRQEAQQDRRF
jgi:hypothetical protein